MGEARQAWKYPFFGRMTRHTAAQPIVVIWIEQAQNMDFLTSNQYFTARPKFHQEHQLKGTIHSFTAVALVNGQMVFLGISLFVTSPLSLIDFIVIN